MMVYIVFLVLAMMLGLAAFVGVAALWFLFRDWQKRTKILFKRQKKMQDEIDSLHGKMQSQERVYEESPKPPQRAVASMPQRARNWQEVTREIENSKE